MASDWGVDFNGDYIFTIEADDRLPEDNYVYIGLEGGKYIGVEEVGNPSEVDVIRLPWEVFRFHTAKQGGTRPDPKRW